MTDQERKELDERFNKYFRDTFIIEKGDLYDKYSDRKIDVSYNFDEERYATPQSVFSAIKDAFENGKGEEMELFLRKLDILAKDKVEAFNALNNRAVFGDEPKVSSDFFNVSQKEMVVINGEYVLGHNISEVDNLRSDPLSELLNNKDDISKIDFKNVAELINTMDSSELYAIMNSDTNKFINLRTERAYNYLNVKKGLDQSAKREKQFEILMLQTYLDHRGHVAFNQNFIDEMIADMIRYGVRKTMGAYLMPLTIFPKAIMFGPGSLFDTMSSIRKSLRNRKIKNMIEGEDEYQFEYKTFERMLKREYYHSELDDINEIDKNRKHIKASNIEDMIEMVEFNAQDYLKEYKEIMPFLKKHRLRKKSKVEMRAFYHNIDRVFSDIERRSGRQLSDITKRLIRNELVLNTFIEKDLVQMEYAVIEEKDSNWFGLKIPLKEGKPDFELLEKNLVLVGEKNLRKLQKEIEEDFGKRKKYLRQVVHLMPNESGGVDLEAGLDENREYLSQFFSDFLPFKEPEEIEKLIDNVMGKEGEDVFSRQPLTVELGGQTFVCETKLDARLLAVLDSKYANQITAEWIRDNLENYVNSTEGKKFTYSYVFEDLYENITSNPQFKLSKQDADFLKDHAQEIERSLRHYESVDTIMKRHIHELKDYKKVEYVLNVFQKNYEINDTNEFYGENPNINRDANTKHERFYERGSDPREEVFTGAGTEVPDFEPDKFEPELTDEDFAIYEAMQQEQENNFDYDKIMSEGEMNAILSSQPEEARKKATMLLSDLRINKETLERAKTEKESKMEQNFRSVMSGKPKIDIIEEPPKNPEFLANSTFIKQDSKAQRNIEEVSEKKIQKHEFEEFADEMTKIEFLDEELKLLIAENEDFSYKLKKLPEGKYEMELFGRDKENPTATLKLSINPDYEGGNKNKMKSVLEGFGTYGGREKARIVARALEGVNQEQIKEIFRQEKIAKAKRLIPELEKGETRARLSNDAKTVFRLARKDYSSKRYAKSKADAVNAVSKEMVEILKKNAIEEKDGFSKSIVEKFNSGTLTLLELSNEISKRMKMQQNPLEGILTKETNQGINGSLAYKLKGEVNKKLEEGKTVPEKEKKNPKNIVDTRSDGSVKNAKTDLERFENHKKKVQEDSVIENKKIENLKHKVEATKQEVETVIKDVKAAADESNAEHKADEDALNAAVKRELDEATAEREMDLKAVNVEHAKEMLLLNDEEKSEETAERESEEKEKREENAAEQKEEDSEKKQSEDIKEEQEEIEKEKEDENKKTGNKRGGHAR